MELKRSARENVFVRKSFYSFFLPSLCSCLGLAIGGLADCVFVGNVVGPVGLTAISIGQPVYMLFNTISYSLSIGGSIHYANALSEGTRRRATASLPTSCARTCFSTSACACWGCCSCPRCSPSWAPGLRAPRCGTTARRWCAPSCCWCR